MRKFFLLLLTEHFQQGNHRMFRTPSLSRKQPAFINSWRLLNNTVGFIHNFVITVFILFSGFYSLLKQ